MLLLDALSLMFSLTVIEAGKVLSSVRELNQKRDDSGKKPAFSLADFGIKLGLATIFVLS